MIPEDAIRRLKAAVPILPEIASRVDLKKSGSAWVGLCPFHRESTPSMSVHSHDDNQFFKCFGCDAKGDVIEFVSLYEAISKIQAIKLLAEQYGIPLESTRQPRPAERYLTEAREHAAFWWKEQRSILVSLLEDACADLFAIAKTDGDVTEAKQWANTCGRLLRRADSMSPESRGQLFLRLRTEADFRRWKKYLDSVQWLYDIAEANPGPIGRLVHEWAERIV